MILTHTNLYVSADTLRVFTLDIHRTKYYFYTNVSIVDGTSTHEQGMQKGEWILRDHLNTRVNTTNAQADIAKQIYRIVRSVKKV